MHTQRPERLPIKSLRPNTAVKTSSVYQELGHWYENDFTNEYGRLVPWEPKEKTSPPNRYDSALHHENPFLISKSSSWELIYPRTNRETFRSMRATNLWIYDTFKFDENVPFDEWIDTFRSMRAWSIHGRTETFSIYEGEKTYGQRILFGSWELENCCVNDLWKHRITNEWGRLVPWEYIYPRTDRDVSIY